MAATDDTSKVRPSRNPSARTQLEQTIEAERNELLQAHGVLACLYEVLLHAEGDDAIAYAQAAHAVASLIDRSVERLDSVRLKPMLDAMEHWIGEYESPKPRGLQLGSGNDEDAVREPRTWYVS
jgi:hypothetical protein